MAFDFRLSGRVQVLDGGQNKVDEKLDYTLSNIIRAHSGTRYTIAASGGTQEIELDSSADFFYITADQPVKLVCDSDSVNVNTTFTADATTDILTTADSLKLSTGISCTLSTTDTLPSPLAVSTTYYIISRGFDKVQLATSLVNAEAGTNIDLTDTGTGVHTMTVTDSVYYQQIDSLSQGTIFLVAGGNAKRLYMKNAGTTQSKVNLWAYPTES